MRYYLERLRSQSFVKNVEKCGKIEVIEMFGDQVEE